MNVSLLQLVFVKRAPKYGERMVNIHGPLIFNCILYLKYSSILERKSSFSWRKLFKENISKVKGFEIKEEFLKLCF